MPNLCTTPPSTNLNPMPRKAPRRARWYVIAGHPANTAAGMTLDADEWIACWTMTRWGARRIARWENTPVLASVALPTLGIGARVVRRSVWDAEH